MAVLRSRIERFLDDLRTGKAVLVEEVRRDLAPHLDAVSYSEDGRVDLSSCSQHLRAVARAYSSAASHLGPDDSASAASAETTSSVATSEKHQVADLNRQLFAHFAEVFRSFTGSLPNDFVPPGSSFGREINRLGEHLRGHRRQLDNIRVAAQEAQFALREHYKASGNSRLEAGVSLPGQKLVLGGAQGFSGSSLNAVRSMLLYADTILIPDPVHRWMETDLELEAFSQVRMLQDIYHISKLRPLVDADLPAVPLVVFPSWEKLMEESDQATREGIERLALQVFGRAVNSHFDDIEEVTSYLRSSPVKFLEGVASSQLFIPMGGKIGEDLPTGIANQRQEWVRLRSKKFLEAANEWSDAEVAFLTIMERLSPQFHVIDNAQTINASPLFALPVHWHYFDVCYQASGAALEEEGILSANTLKMSRALSEKEHSWLAKVPIPDLVRLRADMANLDFRRSLGSILSELEQSTQGNLDSTLSRVTIALEKLLNDHGREVRRLDEAYRRRHAKTVTAFVVSLGAAFLPFLPPASSMVTVAVAAKVAADVVEQKVHRRQMSRTLMGALAASARSTRNS